MVEKYVTACNGATIARLLNVSQAYVSKLKTSGKLRLGDWVQSIGDLKLHGVLSSPARQKPFEEIALALGVSFSSISYRTTPRKPR